MCTYTYTYIYIYIYYNHVDILAIGARLPVTTWFGTPHRPGHPVSAEARGLTNAHKDANMYTWSVQSLRSSFGSK